MLPFQPVTPAHSTYLVGTPAHKNMKSSNKTRRQFIGLMGATGLSLPFALSVNESSAQEKAAEEKPFVDSPPVLQCPNDNAMTVVWAVNGSASGHVEFGTEKDKLDQVAYGDAFGLKPYQDRFLHIRIDGLKPNTRYYYRTATCSMKVHRYNKYDRGPWIYSDVFSFETPGADAKSASFCSINDTHNKVPVLKLLMDRLAEIGSDYTVWTGDLVDEYPNAEMAVKTILRPADTVYAAERPLLLVPGNHDFRGAWARNLPLAAPTWPIENTQDSRLGRNFVVRKGPLALIGLDTGEDKPDEHPEFGGLNFFGPYRVAQRNWLDRALKSPAVSTAPFVVAFCHIPLFDDSPNANGGDVMVRWATFQRQAADLWGPLLNQHGVQLLVNGHMHRFRYDKPQGERTWGQIVGGGCDAKNGPVTIIRGKAEGDSMEVVIEELVKGKELGRWTFAKRKLS